MGLNLSNQQIAKELDLNDADVQVMATHLRDGLVTRIPEVTLTGKVEIDEVYIVAGHKGNPDATQKKVGKDGVDDLKARVAAELSKKRKRRFLA